jgi:hypothetical protein
MAETNSGFYTFLCLHFIFSPIFHSSRMQWGKFYILGHYLSILEKPRPMRATKFKIINLKIFRKFSFS